MHMPLAAAGFAAMLGGDDDPFALPAHGGVAGAVPSYVAGSAPTGALVQPRPLQPDAPISREFSFDYIGDLVDFGSG